MDAELKPHITNYIILVERLAQMPNVGEVLQSTWCPPSYDDLYQWWKMFVDDARKITGKSYPQ